MGEVDLRSRHGDAADAGHAGGDGEGRGRRRCLRRRPHGQPPGGPGCERIGKEAALFVASGTMGNLAASWRTAGAGDEVILGDLSHTFLYEAGASRRSAASIRARPATCRMARSR